MTDGSRRIVLAAMALGLGAMFAVSVQWHMGDHPLVRQNHEAHSAAPAAPVQSGTIRDTMDGSSPEGMAIMGLMQKMQADPHNVETLLELARTFAEQGDFTAARDMAERAVIAAPSDHRAPHMLAVLLGQAGQWQDASAQLERSVSLKDDAAARYSLAVIYRYHLKQEDKARASFEAAAKICQDPALAPLIEAELKR